LLNYFKEELKKYHIERIFITQLGCEDEADYLANEIKGLNYPIEIMRAEVGCVLASHSGPKPLGIAYAIK
ncbi:MAG: DegV family protein, partial [Anaerolineales bacterium]